MFAQVVLLGLAVGAPAAPVKLDAATQAKIRKLQIERRDELRKAVRLRALQLKGGQLTPQELLVEAEALLEAELELATTAQERVTSTSAHCERLKQREQGRAAAGSGRAGRVLRRPACARGSQKPIPATASALPP